MRTCSAIDLGVIELGVFLVEPRDGMSCASAQTHGHEHGAAAHEHVHGAAAQHEHEHGHIGLLVQ